MNRKNLLERDFNHFSARAVDVACNGQLNAEPLIRLLERASIVAQGIGAVLRIERANTVFSEAPEDAQSEPPLSSSTMYSLLELARVSAEALESDIERVADWADKRCAAEGPE
jgi:hypothetical protein